jgi:hypothetical protein
MFAGRFFILQGKTPVPEPDISAWEKWFRTANRRVDETMVGHLRVSTVFLGLDHQVYDGPPLLFETMILDKRNDDKEVYQDQCPTWDEAEEMHKRAVERARGLLKAH